MALAQTHYQPKLGDVLTVELPDERSRGEIVRIISDNTVIVKLVQFTTASKSHQYKRGDFVPCRFRRGNMNLDGWHAVSQSELDAAEEAPEPIVEEVELPAMREATREDIFGTVPAKKKGKRSATHAR